MATEISPWWTVYERGVLIEDHRPRGTSGVAGPRMIEVVEYREGWLVSRERLPTDPDPRATSRAGSPRR